MKRLALIISFLVITPQLTRAQVDVEHRRMLTLQTGFAVGQSEEALGGFGFFWFNEDHYPWTNTALRVIFAGIFVDSELSYFLPASTNTAIGAGLGGGLYIDSITPYVQGERLAHQEFYGDNANARVFINHELAAIPFGERGALPVNVRATYAVSGSFYRKTGTTQNFTLPDDFLTQTILAELRFGGIEPGLTARRGAELYLAAEANYRSGFDAFGPTGNTFPSHNTYQRVYGSLAGKIPIKDTLIYLRIGGGLGEDVDELSSYKLGGNLISVEPFTTTLHGYYTREIFAEDFGIANIVVSQKLSDEHGIAAHLYGDWAVAKSVPPGVRDWDNYFGVGAGLSFRTFWDVNALVSYGYGINAIRNGDSGGHEIGLALEKRF